MNSKQKNETIKALILLRRCIMGAAKVLKDEPGEESLQIAALASVSAAESLDIIDFCITGKPDRRSPDVDIPMVNEMLKGRGELTITLSDGLGSKLTLNGKKPYVRFELIARYEEDTWKNWRKINVERSFPSEDMMVSSQEIMEMLRV